MGDILESLSIHRAHRIPPIYSYIKFASFLPQTGDAGNSYSAHRYGRETSDPRPIRRREDAHDPTSPVLDVWTMGHQDKPPDRGGIDGGCEYRRCRRHHKSSRDELSRAG